MIVFGLWAGPFVSHRTRGVHEEVGADTLLFLILANEEPFLACIDLPIEVLDVVAGGIRPVFCELLRQSADVAAMAASEVPFNGVATEV